MKRRIKGCLIGLSLMLILGGCGSKEELAKGELKKLENEVVEIDIKKLEEFADSEVGNNVAMIGIANSLPGNIFYKNIELHTDREPLGMTVFYDKNGMEEERIVEFLEEYRNIAYKNARETFNLVSNLVYVNYDFTALGGDNIRFKRCDVTSENPDGLKVLELDPYKGVGNLKLGMKKEEVEKVAKEYKKNGFPEIKIPAEFKKGLGKGTAEDYGVFIAFYDENNKAEAFQFTKDLGIIVATELLKGTYEERLEFLKNIEKDVRVYKDSFISEIYGIKCFKDEDITTMVFKEGVFYFKDEKRDI